MGLLDSLVSSGLGSMLGGQSAAPGQAPGQVPGGSQAALIQMALTLVQQNGGVEGILNKFRQSGMGQHVDSWVASGPNPPVSGDQVQQALGSGALANLASQFGMNHGELASGIAQVLPGLIDKLTPNGTVPANHADLISEGLQMLQGLSGAAAKPIPAAT